MSTNTTNISSDDSSAAHQALQDLLPWYASGALGEAEAAQVQQHLQSCSACRAELGWQRKLLETEGPLPAGLDPDRALARLMPQLDAAPAAAQAQRSSAPPAPSLLDRLRAWLDGAGWQGWALAAQCAVIAVLAVQLLPRAPAPDYRALGNGATATPDVLVVFKPEARLQDVQRLMQDNHAQIVGGPTVTGAYMLDVDAGHQPQLLSALRTHPAVERAESLTAASQP